MKKTAVQWFQQELNKLDIEIPQLIFEEAKEMEKQQIIKAVNFTSRRDVEQVNALLENLNKIQIFEHNDSIGEFYYEENFKTLIK